MTVEAVREALSHLATREEAQPVLDGTMTDKEIANVLDAVEAREILKVLRLFRQIRIELPQPRNRLSTVWFDPDARVMVDGEIERQPRVFVSAVRTLSQRLTKETPVLALDGTGSIDLNRRIFGEHMTVRAVRRAAQRRSLAGHQQDVLAAVDHRHRSPRQSDQPEEDVTRPHGCAGRCSTC